MLAVDIYFETFRYEELLTEASYIVSTCPIHQGKITEISGNFVFMKCWGKNTHTCIHTFRHAHIHSDVVTYSDICHTFNCTKFDLQSTKIEPTIYWHIDGAL